MSPTRTYIWSSTGSICKRRTARRPSVWTAAGLFPLSNVFTSDKLRKANPISFPLGKETVFVARLAAKAIPWPASRRPANGAAAEIARRLHLPPAAAVRNSKEKDDQRKHPLDSSGKMGKLLASIVALRFHMAITPASIVRLARFLPHIRPLARRAKKTGRRGRRPLRSTNRLFCRRGWRPRQPDAGLPSKQRRVVLTSSVSTRFLAGS